MAVEFRPETQQVVQTGDTEWTLSGWEVDVATQLWRGPRTRMDAFLNTLKGQQFPVMQGFPRMWRVDAEKTNITPNFPGVVQRYMGFRNGNIPPVRRVNGTSSQVVSATGVDNAPSSPTYNKTLSGQFTYRASRTTYTWFEQQTPKQTPRYNTVDQALDPIQNIENYSIQPAVDDDGTLIPVTYSAFVQILNRLARQVVVSDYEREELVPNILWACRSIVEYRLIGT